MELRASDRLAVSVLLIGFASLTGLPCSWALGFGYGKTRQHYAQDENEIAACASKRIWINLNDANATISLAGQPVEVAPAHQIHQGYICANEGHRCHGMRPSVRTMCETQYTYSNLLARPKLGSASESHKQEDASFALTLVRVPAHCACLLRN